MNKIGFNTVLNIEESKLDLEDNIIYNKIFKNEVILTDINNITFDDCIFENCTINKKFNTCILTNCKFINCDLTNVEFTDSGIHYITITNSKLLSSDFNASIPSPVCAETINVL